MDVLICAGKGTEKIVNTIRPRFNTTGVEIITNNHIDSIKDVIDRGEYFDRAVVLDKGIPKGEEYEVRANIANFIETCKSNGYKDTTYVFVCSDEELATIIYEETISINNQRVVLLLRTSLSVNFTIDCVVKDLKEFDENLVFTMDDIDNGDGNAEIVYSREHDSSDTFNVDDSMTLSKANEIKIDDIKEEVEQPEVEPEPIEEPGIAINDFDSLISEGDDVEFISGSESESADDTDEYEDDNTDVPEAIEDIPVTPIKEEGEPKVEIKKQVESGIENMGIPIDGVGQLDLEQDNVKNLFGIYDGIEDMEEAGYGESDDTDNLDELTINESDISGNSTIGIGKAEVEIEENEIDLGGLFKEEASSDTDNSISIEKENTIKAEAELSNLFDDYADDKAEDTDTRLDINKDEAVIPQTRVEEAPPVDNKRRKKLGRSKEATGGIGFRRGNESNVLLDILKTFRNRGNSLAVTGADSSGKSTIVNNLANLMCSLQCNVLIVDLDIRKRAQAYITREAYDAVNGVDPEKSSIKQALNAVNTGISRYADIVKPGLHVITMGLASDNIEYESLAPRNKLGRFASNARNNYNFIIYDIPFGVAVDYAEDIMYTADNIMITCDKSNHGIMDLMLAMCNIENDEMLQTMFCKTQICFNASKPTFTKFLGAKVRNNNDILKRLDIEIENLLGIEAEYRFEDIPVCGEIPYNTIYEDLWFTNNSIINTQEGRDMYIKLITNVLMKK